MLLFQLAGDPDIEILQYARYYPSSSSSSTTPLAAWVLVTILLISILQKSCQENIISEIYQLCIEASMIGKRQTRPYSKQIHDILPHPSRIFCKSI